MRVGQLERTYAWHDHAGQCQFGLTGQSGIHHDVAGVNAHHHGLREIGRATLYLTTFVLQLAHAELSMQSHHEGRRQHFLLKISLQAQKQQPKHPVQCHDT